MFEDMKETAKAIGEVLGGVFLMGEFVTLYTMVACAETGQPFPEWCRVAFPVYAGFASLLTAALMGGVAVLAAWALRWIGRRCKHRKKLRRSRTLHGSRAPFFSEQKSGGVAYIRVYPTGERRK